MTQPAQRDKRRKPLFRVGQIVMHNRQGMPMKIRKISECGGFEYSSQKRGQIPIWIEEKVLRPLTRKELK